MSEDRPNNEQTGPDQGFGAWSRKLDAVSAPLVVLDRDGRVVGVNRCFAESVSCSPPDLEGCELWELFEADHVESIKQLFKSKASQQQPRLLELRLLSTENHDRPTLWSFSPFTDDGSGSGFSLGVGLEIGEADFEQLIPTRVEDLTDADSVPSEDAGADQEPPPDGPEDSSTELDGAVIGELIRPLVEHASNVICVMEPDSTLSFVSPTVEQVLGHLASELEGTIAFDLIHPDDLETVSSTIEQGLSDPGSAQQAECRIRHADGSWVTMDARGVAHGEDDSLRAVVNLTDISERKQAEEALAESEQRFRSAFDSTAIGKVLWSPDGSIMRANRALCDLLGYAEEEILGLDWRENVHDEDLESVVAAVRGLIAGESDSEQLELRVKHSDGPWIWGRATLSAVYRAAGDPRHIIGEIEDITKPRRAEREKRERLLRIERQQAAVVGMATDAAMVAGDRDAAFQTITEASAEALDVERVAVWLMGDDEGELLCIDLYEKTPASHSEGSVLDADHCPHYFQALQAGRVVDADDARGDPRTEELADDHLKPHDISSVLNAPVRVAGTVVGVVCHEHVGEPRLWQADEIKFAGEVADQAAHAMTSAQRKRSERRLQMSEERFRSIVNCSPMGLLMYRLDEDRQLVFSGSNPAADAILGVDLHDSIGKTLEEIFPPLADTEVPEHYRRAAADGTPWHIEQIEYEDELIRGAYEVHAFQTAPNMVTVMFVDITDRKRAEDALRENEERYRLLFERNLAAVYRSTLDGRITECNDAFATIFGCSSRSDALSRHAQAFYPSAVARSELVAQLRREGELKNHEMVMRRADGEPVWIIANMSLVNDERGQQKIIEGTMVDVTEGKRADDRLILQSSALEAAANAIVISDAGGTIEWVNKAFTRLTGYSAAEAIGESLWILKSGREEGSLYEEPWKAVAAGQVWRGELVNRRKDGRLYTEEMTITPVRGSDGEISRLVAVQQDVTERKRMEEQLLQAQKMEAVGRLAGGVAHDFNNLLQAMLGVTELLRQPDMRSDDAAEKLQELEELVQRGSQLTRQLLLFSRRDTARQEELDLNDLVKGTVKLLHRLLRENIELVFEPTGGGLPLMADRGQIEQVVMNLAVNACDAMPQGGKLSLVTGLDAGSAWLEVSDTGEGIPEDIRDQLFEPFFTTKERGKGTGLGLSVVHGIVNRLGGRIDLDSQIGKGTSIRVTFPAITASGHAVHRVSSSEQLADGGGERVLVVEDDPAVRDSLKEILGVLGYQVTTVGSREELDRLPNDSEFDLLLSDYVLPDGSGTEIADELREKWPSIGVIVMSGYAQDSGVGREVALGNLHFLQKPFSAQALSEAVRNALANGAVVADEALVE